MRRHALLGLVCALLFAALAAAPALAAQAAAVAVLPFALEGDAAESPQRPVAEAMPEALVARYVQSGRPAPVAGEALARRAAELGVDLGGRPDVAAAALLASGAFDEVIAGRLIDLQPGVMVVLQRFVPAGDGSSRIAGAAFIEGAQAQELITKTDKLLNDLYTDQTEVVPRAVERLVIAPSALQVPLGQTRQLNVIAFDSRGERIPNATLLFRSSDASRVSVTPDGTVKAIAPGQAEVQVDVVGRVNAEGPAKASIAVTSPALGVRLGLNPLQLHEGEQPFVVGLRLTPSLNTGGSAPARASDADFDLGQGNPLNLVTGFFSGLIASGQTSLSMDVRPADSLAINLEAISRTSGGYFGTGLGYVTPLGEGGAGGVDVRILMGTPALFRLGSRVSVPIEFDLDLVLGNSGSGSNVRLFLGTGFDLYP